MLLLNMGMSKVLAVQFCILAVSSFHTSVPRVVLSHRLLAFSSSRSVLSDSQIHRFSSSRILPPFSRIVLMCKVPLNFSLQEVCPIHSSDFKIVPPDSIVSSP